MSDNGWEDLSLKFGRAYAEKGPTQLAEEIGVSRKACWEWEAQRQGRPNGRVPSPLAQRMIAAIVTPVTRDVDDE